MAKRKTFTPRRARNGAYRDRGPAASAQSSLPVETGGAPQSSEMRDACREAARLIEAKDFAGAITILEPLDPAKARNAEGLHLLGLAMVQTGRRQHGMSMIDRSILAAPEAGWMLTNRAAVYQGFGDNAAAIADLEKAVQLTPKSWEAWSNLAASASVLGDHGRAAEAAERAARLNPDSAAAQLAHGNCLAREERFEDAAAAYRRAIRVSPRNLNAHVGLLQTLVRSGRDDEARLVTEKVAELIGNRVADDNADAPTNAHVDQAVTVQSGAGEALAPDVIVSRAFQAIGMFSQAVEAAERAAAADPDDRYAWSALGIALYRMDKFEDAERALDRALELEPDWTEIIGALGNVYWSVGRSADAVEMFDRAIEDMPESPSLWASLGAARRDSRDIEGSLQAYAKALELSPENGSFALSLALLQIRNKNFREGCPNYESRWNTDNFKDQVRPYDQPLWRGEDLAGKKILVYAEQGVGDEVMYAGMLQQLVDRGAAVFLEANGRLHTLFDRSLKGVAVGRSENPPAPIFRSEDFDYRLPIGGLIGRLAPEYDDLQPQGAFLLPDAARVAELRERYRVPVDGKAPDLVVGIAWRSGNSVTGFRRSASLERWGPVLRTPGVRFVNLQYGDCAAELDEARDLFSADILHDEEIDAKGDLDPVAAQIAALDLVVSIDNSTIHFAGALGVPTIMMLSYEPDWRWFGGDEGNPWYESVAHIRMETDGDWRPVMEAAADVVQSMAAGGPAPVATDPTRPARVNRGVNPRALLVNDTISWYHWGCTGTSLAIRREIEAKGYDVASTPIPAIYAARPAPPSLTAFDDDRFFQEFVDVNPRIMRQAAEADRIVVNGEGTLHGVSENVRALLYFAYVAARRLGKPVQIINHSCYPEDAPKITDPLANGLYRKVYEQLEYAAFREHICHGLMSNLGVAGVLAFDSLPLTAKRLRPDLPTERERRLVLAGSASADDTTARAFAEYARWASGQGWTPVLLAGARAYPAADETRFLQAIARAGMPAGTELVQATSLKQWLGEFARAGLVATGRFHHSIAAFSMGAPFVAASSNTAKTNALMELLEKPAPLPVNDPDLGAKLIQAHTAALDGREGAAGHAARLEAVETLAMENYAQL